MDDASETEVERLHDLITEFAVAEGYSVKEIYIDRRTSAGILDRPGFQTLCDEIGRSDPSHVLVPDMDHLSTLPAIRTALETKIATRGCIIVPCHRVSPYGTSGLSVRPD